MKRFAKRFEPYGILIAVCALGVAFGTLWVEIDLRNKTLDALDQEKVLREATLEALMEEKLLREATLLSILLEHFELSYTGEYSGHVAIFERVVRTGIDLSNLYAEGVDFYISGIGINLNNADLSYVRFKRSDLYEAQLINTKLNNTILIEADLSFANLRNADLTRAKLQKADMTGADLTGAVLSKAKFRETVVSSVNFKDAKGLQQIQLDDACADPELLPENLPKDSDGEQLVWSGKPCEEEEEEE